MRKLLFCVMVLISSMVNAQNYIDSTDKAILSMKIKKGEDPIEYSTDENKITLISFHKDRLQERYLLRNRICFRYEIIDSDLNNVRNAYSVLEGMGKKIAENKYKLESTGCVHEFSLTPPYYYYSIVIHK